MFRIRRRSMQALKKNPLTSFLPSPIPKQFYPKKKKLEKSKFILGTVSKFYVEISEENASIFISMNEFNESRCITSIFDRLEDTCTCTTALWHLSSANLKDIHISFNITGRHHGFNTPNSYPF